MRGKTGNLPFKPGGLNDVILDEIGEGEPLKDVKRLRSVPPGFVRGLRLAGEQPEGDEELDLLLGGAGQFRRQEEEGLVRWLSSSDASGFLPFHRRKGDR